MEGMERKYGITEVGKEREDDMVRERKRKEKNVGWEEKVILFGRKRKYVFKGGEGNIAW